MQLRDWLAPLNDLAQLNSGTRNVPGLVNAIQFSLLKLASDCYPLVIGFTVPNHGRDREIRDEGKVIRSD